MSLNRIKVPKIGDVEHREDGAYIFNGMDWELLSPAKAVVNRNYVETSDSYMMRMSAEQDKWGAAIKAEYRDAFAGSYREPPVVRLINNLPVIIPVVPGTVFAPGLNFSFCIVDDECFLSVINAIENRITEVRASRVGVVSPPLILCFVADDFKNINASSCYVGVNPDTVEVDPEENMVHVNIIEIIK
jgi:hypothetical protein